jgi:hypothetical protein
MKSPIIMKKIIIYFLVALLGLTVLAFASQYAHKFLAIDACLDGGGRWDYALDKCDHGENPN